MTAQPTALSGVSKELEVALPAGPGRVGGSGASAVQRLPPSAGATCCQRSPHTGLALGRDTSEPLPNLSHLGRNLLGFFIRNSLWQAASVENLLIHSLNHSSGPDTCYSLIDWTGGRLWKQGNRHPKPKSDPDHTEMPYIQLKLSHMGSQPNTRHTHLNKLVPTTFRRPWIGKDFFS